MHQRDVAGGRRATKLTFKVEKSAVLAAPRLALADDDGRSDLLPELRLALLDGGQDHVADAGGGQAIETALDLGDGDDVQVLGAGVVRAVHDGAHGQTEGHAELAAARATASALRHGCWRLLVQLPTQCATQWSLWTCNAGSGR